MHGNSLFESVATPFYLLKSSVQIFGQSMALFYQKPSKTAAKLILFSVCSGVISTYMLAEATHISCMINHDDGVSLCVDRQTGKVYCQCSDGSTRSLTEHLNLIPADGKVTLQGPQILAGQGSTCANICKK